MADESVHQLVLLHGWKKARELETAKRRHLVDIAAEVMADEVGRIGITYAGFCLTSLPHKRLPDGEVWQKRGHRVTLLVEPGNMQVAGQIKPFGIPYGARARLILLYLQSEATRTGSREVEIGRSMRAWMERMGLSVGGETAKALREQAARISACSLKFFWEGEGASGWKRGGIISAGLRFHAEDMLEQPRLWEDKVILDELFWEALKSHPVPLREAALRELKDRSMSLDLYVWLAYRLHQLEKPTPIRWAALLAQFGGGYKDPSHFRPRFRDALAASLAAYPEARVSVGDDGITLNPSAPPVPHRRSLGAV
jgi:hypothetical protein